MLQTSPNTQPVTVAIIGGGVAGATAAVHLGELGLNILLLEKGPGLVNGPPICHLHAGGNLYRDISLAQCKALLRQSIDSVRLFPHTLNRRPTVIAVPTSDPDSPQSLLPRLAVIQQAYRQLVDKDPQNQVLGSPEHYYQTFDREDLAILARRKQPDTPLSLADWMIPFAQQVDPGTLQYPVVAVQEYGWSVFRLAASAELVLDQLSNCRVLTGTTLVAAEFIHNQWQLTYRDDKGQAYSENCDYLINACGFETGKLDDLTHHPRERLVEFKAAYVTRWPECRQQWPEVIFHGPRGTPDGMAQLTPYADGFFQLHGMTNSITLFDDGLAASADESSQPQLPAYLLNKVTQGWQAQATRLRTERAIDHVARLLPAFKSAETGGKPLYGAQQIPGGDATLRAADVTFEARHYARIEVVKGSSALEAAQKIVSTWRLADDRQGLSIEAQHPNALRLTAEQVEQRACQLASARGYPVALAQVAGSQPKR